MGPVDPTLLIMIAAVAVLLLLMFRNGKKRQQQQREMRDNMVPGVEVMLGSGLYGTIVEIDHENNRATLSSGSSTIVVHPGAIAQIVPDSTADDSEEVAPAQPSDDIAPDDDPEFGERLAKGEAALDAEKQNKDSENENEK